MMTPPRIELANLGMWDSLILMVMALVVFGPRRLPEIGRQIGKLMYEVRKASNDFKFQMEEELRKAEDVDRSKKEEQRVAALALAAPVPAVVDSQVPKAGSGAPVIGSDSQVSEARPGPPIAAGAEGVESPYPGEAVYPAVSPAEFQREEPYPRIQPPSTGEPVEAERPGRMAAPLELPATEAAGETTPVTNPVTEQANHG
jgi:sec-independent protein translocase protein TatB